jgi:hypothetical protein
MPGVPADLLLAIIKKNAAIPRGAQIPKQGNLLPMRIALCGLNSRCAMRCLNLYSQ